MLYLFVEGADDRRLVNVLFHNTEEKSIIEYSRRNNSSIAKFIRALNGTSDRYIFFADSDTKSMDQRKSDIKTKFKSINEDQIVIVCIEIESWYYAGMNVELCQKNKIKFKDDANRVSKEGFLSLIKKCSLQKTEIMIEVAKMFDVDLARKRNASFSDFYDRYIKNEEPTKAV